MKIGKYILANAEKVDRAINGSVMSEGQTKGGVGPDAKPAEILAEYDRLGGLILKDGKYKVKTGSFYDLKNKQAHKKPKPVLLFNVNGETIEVSADEPLPLEVQAAHMAEEKKAAKRAKAVAAAEKKAAANKAAKKGKGKKKPEPEEEEDEEDVEDEESEDEDDADEDEGELA